MDNSIFIIIFAGLFVLMVPVALYFASKHGKQLGKPTIPKGERPPKSPNFYRIYIRKLGKIKKRYGVELDSLAKFKNFDGEKWFKQYALSAAKDVYKHNLQVVSEFNEAVKNWESQGAEYTGKVLTIADSIKVTIYYTYTTPAGKKTYQDRFVGVFKLGNVMSDIVNTSEELSGFMPVDDWLDSGQSACEYTGVYILFNADKDMYYVGQAKNVGKRIDQHRTGRGGNPDVYFDWRSGDHFFIKTISLSDSDFDNLDRLEMYMIDKYDACVSGYNKTVGNQV